MIDFNHYIYFSTVVEHGGFSAAERVTNIPKSKLSRHVSQLEQHLGIRLIQRNSRQFVVTELGQTVYEHTLIMREQANAINALAHQAHIEPRGHVRVSVPVSIAQRELAHVLPAFMQQYPDISLNLYVSNRRVDLIQEGFDVALRVRAELTEDHSLVFRAFGEMKQYMVASPEYLHRHGTPLTPDDLKQHQLLSLANDEPPQTWQLENGEDEYRLKFHPRASVSDLNLLTHLALTHHGIALLPEPFSQPHLQHGELIHILADWHIPQGIFHAVYPSHHGMLPAVRVFIDYLTQAFRSAD